MSLLATAADYVPANAVQGRTALYYRPSDGSAYGPEGNTNIPMRKAWIESQNPTGKIAVWGCCWGYLVSLLVADGYDAHGYDGSSWAITTGQGRYATISTRLHVRDATVATDVTASRADAGLQATGKFALLMTDDMLPCCSDAEIAALLPRLRAIATTITHVVTPLDTTTTQDSRLNWKSVSDWKTAVAPDAVLDVWSNA